MEESVAGFRVEGDWGEIVEHGERITRALRDAGAEEAYPEAFEAWEDWRPKSGELLGIDVRKKTAEHASIEEGAGEKEGKSPNEDVQKAGEKLTESYESLEGDDAGEAVEKWQDSLSYVARAAETAGRKAIRSVEDAVYRNVMTQLAPYYFDNELVSANVARTGDEEAPFALEVNVNDDDLKRAVADRLAEYVEEVERWHVETETETGGAEAAEGVEAPESEAESVSEAGAGSTTGPDA
ncbi:MAG: DUF5828 family protein [Halanaeroarchaeum sp.]